jgi:hypothetical protein
MLVIKVGPDKASICFEEGTIVHSEFRDLTGQESVGRIFRERAGSFQFLAGEEGPSKDIAL